MTNVTLLVQNYGAIAEVQGLDDLPHCSRISVNSWEIPALDLVGLNHKFISGDIAEVLGDQEDWNEATKVFVRRFKGAIDRAMKASGGWSRIDDPDSSYDKIKNESGISLQQAGAIAVRYPCDSKGDHLSIDILMKDGFIIVCPCDCKTLISAAPYILRHLNNINFQGSTWKDTRKSSWRSFDHLVSVSR